MRRVLYRFGSFGLALVTGILILTGIALFSQVGQTQNDTNGFAADRDLIERQIVVMLDPNVVNWPYEQIQANVEEIGMPSRIVHLLQEYNVRELQKGIPSFQPYDTLRVLPDGELFKVPDYSNMFVITLPPGTEREPLVEKLSQLPGIRSAEVNQSAILYETFPPPSEGGFYFQWNLKNNGQFGGGGDAVGADIKATFAWDYTKGSTSVKLGILDTGVDANAGDFIYFTGPLAGQSKVEGDVGWSSDHGTFVAGIAGAVGDNGGQMVGVDWYAKIRSERIDGGIPGMVSAVNDAVNASAKVLNLSWGISSYSPTLYSALFAAHQANRLIVAANPSAESPGGPGTGDYPHLFGPWVMSVGSVSYSCYAVMMRRSRV